MSSSSHMDLTTTTTEDARDAWVKDLRNYIELNFTETTVKYAGNGIDPATLELLMNRETKINFLGCARGNITAKIALGFNLVRNPSHASVENLITLRQIGYAGDSRRFSASSIMIGGIKFIRVVSQRQFDDIVRLADKEKAQMIATLKDEPVATSDNSNLEYSNGDIIRGCNTIKVLEDNEKKVQHLRFNSIYREEKMLDTSLDFLEEMMRLMVNRVPDQSEYHDGTRYSDVSSSRSTRQQPFTVLMYDNENGQWAGALIVIFKIVWLYFKNPSELVGETLPSIINKIQEEMRNIIACQKFFDLIFDILKTDYFFENENLIKFAEEFGWTGERI